MARHDFVTFWTINTLVCFNSISRQIFNDFCLITAVTLMVAAGATSRSTHNIHLTMFIIYYRYTVLSSRTLDCVAFTATSLTSTTSSAISTWLNSHTVPILSSRPLTYLTYARVVTIKTAKNCFRGESAIFMEGSSDYTIVPLYFPCFRQIISYRLR